VTSTFCRIARDKLSGVTISGRSRMIEAAMGKHLMRSRVAVLLVLVSLLGACIGGRNNTEPLPRSHTRIENVWLVGGLGDNIAFCRHGELMNDGTCQPLSLVASQIPRVLPPPERPSSTVSCLSAYRLIFNFADRPRAVYEDCLVPNALLPLYDHVRKLMVAAAVTG
jgi:hypothetical protein